MQKKRLPFYTANPLEFKDQQGHSGTSKVAEQDYDYMSHFFEKQLLYAQNQFQKQYIA